MSVWATFSGIRETTVHFGTFSLSSVQLDSNPLSREGVVLALSCLRLFSHFVVLVCLRP